MHVVFDWNFRVQQIEQIPDKLATRPPILTEWATPNYVACWPLFKKRNVLLRQKDMDIKAAKMVPILG